MLTWRFILTVPFVLINERISNTLNRNTKRNPSKSTYQPNNFWMLFSISYKYLQDSNPEGKKCLKPLSSVLNANVFVYDGFNTDLKINDFQQLHSRPINRSEYYKIHTEEEQLDNLQHQYLSRKSWKYRTCFFLFSECTLLQKLKTNLWENLFG